MDFKKVGVNVYENLNPCQVQYQRRILSHGEILFVLYLKKLNKNEAWRELHIEF